MSVVLDLAFVTMTGETSNPPHTIRFRRLQVPAAGRDSIIAGISQPRLLHHMRAVDATRVPGFFALRCPDLQSVEASRLLSSAIRNTLVFPKILEFP